MKECNIASTRILLGENRLENSYLLSLNKDFTWVHAKSISSGHAVIESINPTIEELNKAKEMVKKGCKGKKDPNFKVEYTKIINLEIVGIGEVITNNNVKYL